MPRSFPDSPGAATQRRPKWRLKAHRLWRCGSPVRGSSVPGLKAARSSAERCQPCRPHGAHGSKSAPATRTRRSTARREADHRRIIFGVQRRRVRHRGHIAFASIRVAPPAISFARVVPRDGGVAAVGIPKESTGTASLGEARLPFLFFSDLRFGQRKI